MNGTHTFFRDKIVLITGASSGIGKGLALQLAKAGAKLTLAARRPEQLAAVAQKIAAQESAVPIEAPCVMRCDVACDGDVEQVVAECVRRWGKLDVVFANAGFGVVGGFKKLSVEDYRRQFETNVFGVLRTIYAALPELEKSRGNLVITGSVSGWIAPPGASPYCMSKFAVRALANSITPELSRANVKMTLISPGFVVSNIRRVDNRGTVHPDAADPVPAWIQMTTQNAARQILRAVARGKKEEIITLHGKLLVAFERFLPWINRAFAYRMTRVYDSRSSL